MKVMQKIGFFIGVSILAASSVLGDYSNTIATFKPLAYWRLDETAQPPAGDVATNIGTLGASANGYYFNNATHPAQSALTADAGSSAYFPDVSGNRVRVPYNQGFSGSTPFSVEFWAQPASTASGDSDQFQTVASLLKYGDSGWAVYQHGSQGWTFSLYGSGGASFGVNAPKDIVPGTWYHVVAVYNGTQAILYVNGQQLADPVAVDSYVPVTDTSIPFTISARGDGASGFYRFGGLVDEVAFYTNVLSAQDALTHYQNGTSSAPATPYQQLVQAKHPAVYYRLDEPSFTSPDPDTLPVAANSGSLGTVVNGHYEVGTVPGVTGIPYAGLGVNNHAVKFDRVLSTYVDVGGNAELDLISSLTVIAWVKPDLSNGRLQTVLGKGDASYRLNINGNGVPSFANGTSADVFATHRVDDGKWHQLVGVYDSTAEKNYIFVDGLLDGAQLSNGSSGDQGRQVTIGRAPDYDTDRFYSGEVDEVAIFDAALTPDQIQEIYYSGSVPPWIVVQPRAPEVLNAGDSITLGVSALGTPALSYQWIKNGLPISGKTATNLVFASLGSSDSANYAVVITNNYGAITSAIVTLDVKAAPIVLQSPKAATRYAGGAVTFSVTAVGSLPLSYQWRSNSFIIEGAVSSNYTLSNLQVTYSGTYSVTVSNSSGATNSLGAQLTVISTPAGAYPTAIVSGAPIGYWRLGETDGSTAYDAISGFDGTYIDVKQGAVGFFAADSDKGAQFGPQINSYVGNIQGIDFSSGSSFTLEAWVKGNSTQAGDVGIISKGTGGGGEQFNLDTGGDSGHYRLGIRTSDGSFHGVSAGVGPDNTWQHLVGVVDNSTGTLSLYVNDVLQNSTSFTAGTLLNSAQPVSIGSRQSGTGAFDLNFHGTIDDVAIYNYALTQSQVDSHYNLWVRPGQAPLIGQQPVSTTNYIGLGATFSVDAQGADGLTYQWQFNGVDINGEVNSTLTVSSLNANKAGNYSVVVTNPYGHANSTQAHLSVLDIPRTVGVSSGLVLHLKFDGDYKDYSGRGNDATPVGTPTFVTGKVGGQALHFSSVATHNYLTLGSPADLLFSSNVNFSVSYWVRTAVGDASVTGSPVFGNASYGIYTPGYDFGFAFGPPGAWTYSFNDQASAPVNTTGASIGDGNWHHLLFTLDRKGLATAYLDGYQVDTQLLAHVQNIDRGAILIGQTPVQSASGQADVDDLSVWRRVLTPLEVGAIYTAGNTYGASVASASVGISIKTVGAQVKVDWSGGSLQSADNASGPYSDVNGATSPYNLTPSGAKKFFRVRE